ncbi:MAG: hypothetical protein GY869_16195 [Planctomycetes bacterium]|nr:hypothetical protein [Planctomycetota bacterium]
MTDSNENPETGCCPRFNPEPWQDQKISWQDKLFVKDRVRSIFHIPINFGKVMIRNMEKIDAVKALSPDVVGLSDENSLWGSDIYIAVEKDVPNTQMQKISGTFLTKVFEGPYQNARKWCVEMQQHVNDKNENFKKMYFYYTTCPKCAKAYGKNYVVLLAQI